MKRVGLNDLLAMAGAALLGAGLWMWWQPAALMVIGGLMLAVAFGSALMRGRG